MDVDVEPGSPGHVQGTTESEPHLQGPTGQWETGPGGEDGGKLDSSLPGHVLPGQGQAHYFLIPPSFSREATSLNVRGNHRLSGL